MRDPMMAILFFAILAVHIFAGEAGYADISSLSKPLLLLSLIAFVILEILRGIKSAFAFLALAGLFFSLIGDILLIFQEWGDYFVYGLGAFLTAHVFYIFAFNKTYLENHEIRLLKRYGWVSMLIVAYGFFFFNTVKDFLHEMMGPVLIYMMVISVMMMVALNRYKKVKNSSFFWIAIGAFSFFASDSLLAWNKFVREIDYSHFLIMFTYGFAQFGIAKGAIIQIRDTSLKSIPKESEPIG